MSLEAALARAVEHRDADLAQFFEELSIPSVATQPQHRADTIRNAEWLVERFRHAGFEARNWGAEHGAPLVCAEWRGRPEAPMVTIYGHYDVQPAEPLDLWTSPPFEPSMRDGRVWARGAADSKGNHFPALKAAEHAIAAGGPPVNLRFLIEGEEEGGGVVLPRYIAEHLDQLATDCVLVWDGGLEFDGRPVLCTGLRGILYTEIHARGAAADLHSGGFGGAAPNPINSLARVIAGLKDADGRITIPGFYDRVQRATSEELAAWAAWKELEPAITFAVGAKSLEGEAGWSLAERLTVRPTLDANGIWGGFTEEGGEKTVIPAQATAKVSMRLVPDQDPEEIFAALVAYAPTLSTPGVELQIRKLSSSPPVLMPADHAAGRAATAALEEAFGLPVRLERSGGSIPVVSSLQRLRAPLICGGFPQFDNNAHSPDESFELDYFHRGVEMLLRFFWRYPEEARAQD